MKNQSKNIDPTCVPQKSSCITWTGKPIPALGINTGDCLNDVIYIIATKLEQVLEPLDVSEIDIQCMVDALDVNVPEQLTLINLLQLMIVNDCRMQSLIESLQNSLTNPGTTLQLNLGCLAQYDSFGNLLPYNEQTVLQTLVTEVCAMKGSISALALRTSALESALSNFKGYQEPVINTCLSTNKPLSQAFSLIATDFCNYKKSLGSIEVLDSFVSKLSTEIKNYYQAVPGFKINPTTVGENLNNTAIVINDFFQRISQTELCCDKGCDSIALGFGLTFNNGNLILLFNNLYGTKIPSGYIDCGTTFTIRDEHGGLVYGNLTITNNYESEEISLVGLEKGDVYTINLDTKFCNGTQTCNGCYSKTFRHSGECCVVTNQSSEEIVIIYQTTQNNS